MRYTKASDIQATTKMNMYGQDYVYSVSANMTTAYEVASKDSNGYNVKITLEAINSELSSNGVKMSFNSQKDTLNIDDTIFAKPLSDILGETDEVVVDSFGEITKSDTSLMYRKAREYITSTLLSGNDYSIGKTLDIVFRFKDSVKVGVTWRDSVEMEDGFRIDTFKIDNIYNKVIYVSINSQVSRSLPVQQGVLIARAHFVGTTNTVLKVSAETGLIQTRAMNTHIQSKINVNDMDIPISSDIQFKEVIQ